MAASVEQLKGLFSAKRGVARGNLFQVTLPPIAGSTPSELNLLCKDVTIPGRQIATYDKEIGTVREKVAYGEIHDDVTMTFLVLNDYGVKKYFDTWQSLAYDQSNFQIGYKSDYVRDVQISQLNKAAALAITGGVIDIGDLGPINIGLGYNLSLVGQDSFVYTCTLVNAWPVTINAIQLTNEQDNIVELQVQLTYTKAVSAYNF